MFTSTAFEGAAGLAAFALALLAFRPLLSLHRRAHRPALLRNETTAELVLIAYLYVVVLGFAFGLHGLIGAVG
jgi:hypothetical protein